MVSKSSEEYLKIMYMLKKQKGYIRVTDIANRMNCTKPSVNKALNNLKESNMVNYKSYGPIELTKEGEDLAKKIIETYGIVYLFLKDVLGIERNEAIKEAEKIKLVIADDTINKLAKYVHSELNLDSLDCCYDVNEEKCRSCKKRVDTKKLLLNTKLNLTKSRKIYKKGKEND